MCSAVEVLGMNGDGCALEQRARRRRLRKRDDVAQRVRAGQQHRDAVEAERNAAVRRCAGRECLEQEAESTLLVSVGNAEQTEDRLLDSGIGDPMRRRRARSRCSTAS